CPLLPGAYSRFHFFPIFLRAMGDFDLQKMHESPHVLGRDPIVGKPKKNFCFIIPMEVELLPKKIKNIYSVRLLKRPLKTLER
ncbi:MAG: hypothetical protein ACYTDW_10390, partial [Planctomycetota bacterium]